MKVLVVPSFCCECSYSTDLSPKWLGLYSKVQAGKSLIWCRLPAQVAPKGALVPLDIAPVYRLRPNPTSGCHCVHVRQKVMNSWTEFLNDKGGLRIDMCMIIRLLHLNPFQVTSKTLLIHLKPMLWT